MDTQSRYPECSICYEQIKPIDNVTLQCDHKFHKQCLGRWSGNPKNPSDANKTCPVCRGPLEVKRTPEMIRRDTTGGRRRRTGKRRRTHRRRYTNKRIKINKKTRKYRR